MQLYIQVLIRRHQRSFRSLLQCSARVSLRVYIPESSVISMSQAQLSPVYGIIFSYS